MSQKMDPITVFNVASDLKMYNKPFLFFGSRINFYFYRNRLISFRVVLLFMLQNNGTPC